MLILPPTNLRKVWISFWKLVWLRENVWAIRLKISWVCYQNLSFTYAKEDSVKFEVPSVVVVVVLFYLWFDSHSKAPNRCFWAPWKRNKQVEFSAHEVNIWWSCLSWHSYCPIPLISIQVIRTVRFQRFLKEINASRWGSWKLTVHMSDWHRDGEGLPPNIAF